MGYYAIKSLMTKKIIAFLYIAALCLAVTMSMLSINISSQIQEGFYSADQKYDVVIGPAGSDVQLVMSSLFFSDEALGTINYSYVEKLQEEGLQTVIPLGIGDNYRGARIIGSSPELLTGYKLKEGSCFEDNFEIVVGSAVATAYDLKIGDQIISSHGMGLSSHEHDQMPYTVVGILNQTHTAYDNVLFTTIESIWDAHSEENHEHEEEHEYEENHEHEETHGHEENHEHEEAHDHESEQTVTAVLVRSGSISKASKLVNDYSTDGLQAVNVTQVLRKLMNNVDLSKQVALILTGIIVILAALIVVIMTFLMAVNFKKDIHTLQFIDMPRYQIKKYIYIQSLILSGAAWLLGILLSRAGIMAAGEVSSQFGIVLNSSKFYGQEMVMSLALCLLSFIPVIIYVNFVLRKENDEQ